MRQSATAHKQNSHHAEIGFVLDLECSIRIRAGTGYRDIVCLLNACLLKVDDEKCLFY